MRIVVYTAPSCMGCRLVKNKLTGKGVPYVEVRLDEHPEEADRLRDLGLGSAPVVEAFDSEGALVDRWGGMRPDRLDDLLARAAS